MTYPWCGLAVILSALPLAAGTIESDVSAQVSASLNTGDALWFTVPSWNFGIDAANFGIPEYPTSVGFVFVTASEDSLAQVEAVLVSGDGSVSVSFGAPLSFVPAMFQGSAYSGAVSVLEGSLQLSETLSQQLFGSSPAVLTLLNTGPALSLEMPPYTLQQDLNVSLGGSGLGVGARLGGVALMADPPDPPDVPEPGSGLLLLGGGALLWALSRLRRSELSRGAEGALERDSD
jgi:hypothetical protein